MKKLLVAPFLFFATTSFSGELHNFAEVKSAVITGKQIHIATDFTKCTSSNKNGAYGMVGIYAPTELQALDTRIVTSFMHFTLNNPGFLDKPVYQFVKYTISDDNNLTLSFQVLDARNYSPLSEKKSYVCKLDDGVKIYD